MNVDSVGVAVESEQSEDVGANMDVDNDEDWCTWSENKSCFLTVRKLELIAKLTQTV